MYYCYILKSEKDGKLYLGSTNNLSKRLREHAFGKVFSTKYRRPLALIYYEAYCKEADARKREKNLKLQSRSLTQLKRRIHFG
jgi:putative endonuclease